MTEVVIMRGLPGSGKSTLADRLLAGRHDGAIVSADYFFVGSDGVYRFDPKKLGEAHGACREAFVAALDAGLGLVIVDNTNTQKWEFEFYLTTATARGARVTVVPVFDGGCSDEQLAERNTHGVPLSTIAAMRARWEESA